MAFFMIRDRAFTLAAAAMMASLWLHPVAAAEKVTYLLPAPAARPAFGPWMVAKQRGYYAAEGLDIEFQTAAGGVDVAKQVGVGNAPIGGALGDTPIIVRGNGVPVKAVAVLGGGGLAQLIVKADSTITGPADLKGKTVTVLSYQDTTYYALLGMLAHVGLTKNDVNILAGGPSNVWKLFLVGQADAIASAPDYIGYVTEAGAKIRVIPGERYFQSMAQAVLASDTMIKENPELIRRLVRATLHGMRDVMEDPQAAAIDFVKATPENAGREPVVAEIFTYYNRYVYAGQAKPGAMDEKRLSALQDFYVAQGIARTASPVKELYTNEFVQ
jgi:NitT/TauT family transport system substrate-binding protein